MAELDLSLGEQTLRLLAEISGGMQSTHKVLQHLLALEQRYQIEGPTNVQLRGASGGAATGNLVIGLGGPSQGRKWEIRRLIIGGSTFGSTVAGTAEVYVSAVPGAVVGAGRNLADMVDQASGATPSLPSVAFYGAGQIVLRYPQELKIVIVSPTASTPYEAGGAAIDLPDMPAHAIVDV